METVYGWVRNLVCFYIFMTAVLHLLPKESYRKYVRFFTGLLLVVLVLTPVLSVLQDKDMLYDKIMQAGFWQDTVNMKLDTEYLEDSQKEIYQREYRKAIGMDISRMAETLELETQEAEVNLDQDYQVAQIFLQVSFTKDYQGGRERAMFEMGEEYPVVHTLKQELMEFYKVTEDQIEIVVQGGQ